MIKSSSKMKGIKTFSRTVGALTPCVCTRSDPGTHPPINKIKNFHHMDLSDVFGCGDEWTEHVDLKVMLSFPLDFPLDVGGSQWWIWFCYLTVPVWGIEHELTKRSTKHLLINCLANILSPWFQCYSYVVQLVKK